MRQSKRVAAIVAAVLAAGCSGSGATRTGSERSGGIAQGTYEIQVLAARYVDGATTGGRVTSVPAGIDCGDGATACSASFPLDVTVTLTTQVTGQGFVFFQWAADCSGESLTCSLAGPVDRYAAAYFGLPSERRTHARWSDAEHAAKAAGWLAGATDALDCRSCHGWNLEGVANVPSCAACHAGKPHIRLDTSTFTSGPAVTAVCVKCHDAKAQQMLGSNHFTWLGSSTSVGHTTPSSIGKRNVINNFCVANASNEARCMQCHPSYSSAPTKDGATGAFAVNTGPMYLWSANPGVDKSRIDCLVCHADLAASKYMKGPAGFGQPWVATSASCFPSCAANQICSATDSAGVAWTDGVARCRAPVGSTEVIPALKAAALSIGSPQRANCGFCHFNAGGGDNVKMGDLGSALKTPTQDVDVHMGSSASYAPRACADCHQSGSHTVRGAGLSIPVDNEGRLTCTDCHSGLHAPAHSDATYSAHADFMACQTCHIPAFSRTQFTKMNWDWQTAADKKACQGLPGCSGFGTITYPAGNAQSGTVPGVGGEAPKGAVTSSLDAVAVEQGYDWKKGVSTYAKGVVPAYRFIAPASAQQGTHETTTRDGLMGSGTESDPYRLSDVLPPPAPVLAGWKIAPFKRMTGRSPAFADGSAMLVPHVFGNDSLWQSDLRGYPVVANDLGSSGNPWTQAKADVIWTGVLNYGAAAGGQLGAPIAKAASGQMTRDATSLVTVNTTADLPSVLPATLYLVGAEAAFPTGVKNVTRTGTRQFTYQETIPNTVNPAASPPVAQPVLPAASTQFVSFYTVLAATDWKWAYTQMLINLNHEVAPKAQALTCASCHPSMGGSIATSRMRELYDLKVGGCEDPALCRKR